MRSSVPAIRTAGVGAAAAPVALAMVIRALIGGAPADANAAAAALAPDTAEIPTPVHWSADEADADAYAIASLREPFADSPMHRVPARAAPVEPAPTAPTVAPEPTPTFIVTSVLVGRRATLVTINGRLRRLGDEVEPGWRLESIDIAAGEVILIAEDGRRDTVSITHLVK